MKRLATVAVLLLILVIGGLVGIWYFIQSSKPGDPWGAVPEETPVIFSINQEDWSSKLETYRYLPLFSDIPVIKKLERQINIFSLISDAPFTQSVIGMQKIRIDAADFFFINGVEDITTATEIALSRLAENDFVINRRNFRETTIYEAENRSLDEKFSFAFTDGLLIFSETPFLVDACIIQLRTKQPIAEGDFGKSLTLSNRQSDVTLYLQMDYFGQLSSIFFKNAYSHIFQNMHFLGNQLVLDVNFQVDAILFNGYSYDHKGIVNFLTHFHGEAPERMEILSTLPEHTAAYQYFGSTSFASYIEALEMPDSVKKYKNYFVNWVGKEWVFGIVEPLRPGFFNESFLIVETTEPDITLKTLEDLHYILAEDRDNLVQLHRGYAVYQFESGELLNHFFGKDMPTIFSPYYTVIGDYVLFSNSLTQHTGILDRLRNDQTLTKNIQYFQFSRNLSSYSNASFMLNVKRTLPALHEVSNNNFNASLNQAKDYLNYFPKVALQFNSFRNMFFINGYIPYDTTSTGTFANRVWQTTLDAPVLGRPNIVVNHNNQEKEIFVQDEAYNIYLINRAGDILWKRELGERIVGDVYQMDVSQNDRLQFLFTTPTRIFLIDRTGNTVTNFPIRLPAEALSGITLVDYDDDKQYRFFVACSNGNIYGYRRGGNPLPGWSPNAVGTNINFPLRYERSGGRDFLVALNRSGEIFMLNRRGQNRTEPVKLQTRFNHPYGIYDHDGKLEIYNADQSGLVYRINEDSSVDSLELATETSSPGFAFIEKPSPALVLADTNVIEFFTIDGDLVNRHHFSEDMNASPRVIQSGRNDVVVIQSAHSEMVYAFNTEGVLLYDFPLPGSGEPAIDFLLSERNLVVVMPGLQNFITTYRLE